MDYQEAVRLIAALTRVETRLTNAVNSQRRGIPKTLLRDEYKAVAGLLTALLGRQVQEDEVRRTIDLIS